MYKQQWPRGQLGKKKQFFVIHNFLRMCKNAFTRSANASPYCGYLVYNHSVSKNKQHEKLNDYIQDKASCTFHLKYQHRAIRIKRTIQGGIVKRHMK